MSFNVLVTENFKKESKRLIKKYKSLKLELKWFGEKLATEPTIGTPLGHNVYKVRLSVKSKGRGKSGGIRVITS